MFVAFRDECAEAGHFVRINAAYNARSNEELTVANGDLVLLLSQRLDAQDGWWTGVRCYGTFFSLNFCGAVFSLEVRVKFVSATPVDKMSHLC